MQETEPDYRLSRREAHKITEVALAFDVSRPTVDEWIKAGRLREIDAPGPRRITDASVRALLAGVVVPAQRTEEAS